MGLDMYLTRETYVKNWEHMKAQEKHKITITKAGKATGIKPERVSYITEEIGCWRKANAIHKWFVDNVQDGKDDCRTAHVSREKLEELLDVCKKVAKASKLVDGKIENGYSFEGNKLIPNMVDEKLIEDASVAKELLCTTEGFFFGNTDYNEYYLENVKYTIKMLEGVLAEKDEAMGDYEYHSSW